MRSAAGQSRGEAGGTGASAVGMRPGIIDVTLAGIAKVDFPGLWFFPAEIDQSNVDQQKDRGEKPQSGSGDKRDGQNPVQGDEIAFPTEAEQWFRQDGIKR